MKRLTKLLIFLACKLAVFAFINHLIFKIAGAPAASRFESRKYKWRPGRLRYVVAGKGEPVLLLHGLGAGSSLLEWEELTQLLSTEYRVYALDFLGYGESAKPNISYSAYLFASQVNDFIREVIGSPVHVVASSGGGTVAMAACALKPELYSKMMLVSPVGASHSRTACEGRLIQALIDMPIVGTTIYNVLTSRMFYRSLLVKNLALPLDCPDEMYRSAHAGGVGNKYPVAACFSEMMGLKLDAVVPQLKLPMHVCWGALNASNPLSNFRAMRSANDNIALTVFGNSGAFPHRNQPNKFYRLCRFFFG
jgi:pimeloyl-ACP methyl ester carboxylesterase